MLDVGRWRPYGAAVPVSTTHACACDGRHPCPYRRRDWCPCPAASVVLPHADSWLFGKWQVHADHTTGVAVPTHYDAATCPCPTLLQIHAVNLLGVGLPGPHAAAGWGAELQQKLSMEPKTFVIVYDMQATHACLVIAWFMHKFHHYNMSTIHLVKNVFNKDLSHRIISLNTTYTILFKNPRHISQVSQANVPQWQQDPDGSLLGCHGHRRSQLRGHQLQIGSPTRSASTPIATTW